MAKSFTVSFNIAGALDGSLVAALTTAAQKMKQLGAAAQALNGKSIKLSQALNNNQALLKNIEAYKALQQAVNQTQAARIQAVSDSAKLLRQRNAEQKQLDAMKAAYQRLQKYYRENKKSMGTDAAEAMKSQLKSARDELKAQQNFVRNLGTSYNKSNARIESLNNQLAQQRSQLSQMRTTIPTSNIAAAESALRAQINQTTAALNQEIAALQRRNEVASRFNQSQQNLSNAYSNFQNAIQTAETIMNPFVDATKNAMDFEHAMSRVKALSQMRDIRAGNFDKVSASMERLTNQAKQLGAVTEFTSTEIAQAQGYYAMAGWDDTRIMAVMQSTVDLASIAGDHNLARTADVLSDDMSAFGIKAGQSYKLASGKIVEGASFFTDAYAFALTQANLDREALHEAWKYNAASAKTAGMSLGETFAMNMVVANSGIKGSQAGTTFRAGWTRFLAPPKTAQKSLEEMGMTASDATKQIMEAQAALNEAGASIDDDLFTKITKAQQYYQSLDKNQRAGWLKNLVGQNALTGWQVAFDSGNFQDIIKFAKEIDSGEIEGWAKDTAAVMRDDTATAFELLKSSVDACAESFGHTFLNATRNGLTTMSQWAGNLNTWIQQHQTLVQYMGLTAAAMSAIIVAGAGIALVGATFSFLSSGAAMAMTAIRGLGTAFMFIANMSRIAAVASAAWGAITAAAGFIASAPIWLVVAAVVAVVAAILYATGAADGLGTALSEAWNHPQGAITGFANLVNSTIDNVVNYVMNRWNTLKSALEHPIDAVINFIDHGDVIGGSVKSGEQQALEAKAHTVNASSGGIGAIQERAAQIDSGNVDTSQVQSALDNVAPSAQNASTGLDSFSQITQQFSTAGFDVTNFTTGMTNAGVGIQTFSTNATTAGTQVQTFGTEATTAQAGVQTLGNSAQTATSGIDALSAASSAATGGIEALSSASGGAAGSVSGLGAAAQSAIAQMAAAGANAAAAVNAAAASIPTSAPAANFAGGIYKRGAFLTTFAEKSPEAAIPIDNSQRARDLWFNVGKMLGTLPGTSSYDSAPKDSLGNLKNVDIPEYNRIGEGDSIAVRRSKMQAQREQFNRQPTQPTNQNRELQRQINSIRQQYARETLRRRAGIQPQPTIQPVAIPNQPVTQSQPTQSQPTQNQSIQRQINSIRQRHAHDILRQRQTPAEHNRQLREQVLSGRLSIDDAVNQVKMPSGATIGDALKYLPAQSKSILPNENFDVTGGLAPDFKSPQSSTNIFDGLLNKIPSPTGLFDGLINKIPSPTGLFDGLLNKIPSPGGLFDDLIGGLTSPQPNSNSMTFNVSINVTANGSDENSIRNGVESAVPSLEDWAEKFAAFKHDEARRSFA